MTDDQILLLAKRHSAYCDTVPTLRGDSNLLAFGRDLLEAYQQILLMRLREHSVPASAEHFHK